MPPSLEDHAARFDELAAEYDGHGGPAYETAARLVIEHAAPTPSDVVLDIGTGTGAIALALAADARMVLGRDISDGMLVNAREKSGQRGIDNVDFGAGRFRAPNVPAETAVDIVTSNFAMHHLSDADKREAIGVSAGLAPRRIVLGDVMFFGEPDPDEPFYSPAVDDPATVGVLADAFTDVGYAITAVEQVHEQVGVLVAEPHGGGPE